MTAQNLHLDQSVKKVFTQITTVLNSLTDSQYSMPSNTLFNATIGQHVRHIIELFIELDKGYETGIVNYEKRKRDYRIETDKNFACALLCAVCNLCDKPNKQLFLEGCYDENLKELITLETNYLREIAYNIEHSIHHMALIRVGVNELSTVEVDENFGIAASTIKHHTVCVQ